jgi:allantoin racemase
MKIAIINITPVPEQYLGNSEKTVAACCGHVINFDTTLHFRAPKVGPVSMPQYIEDYRNPYFQNLMVREVIETIVAADREGFDALVVNCFDDPGVKEARALIDTPVFGLSEPTFHYACQLGEKIGALVPDMPGQVAFVRNQFEAAGLGSRLIANGVRAERKPFRESLAEALRNPQPMIDRLKLQTQELVDDGANVIVIACGGLGQFCGLLNFHGFEYNGAIVPVVSPLTVAVKTAETMVTLQRALGTTIPSYVHAKRLSREDVDRIETAFDVIRRH